jgi:hypothetical protein
MVEGPLTRRYQAITVHRAWKYLENPVVLC